MDTKMETKFDVFYRKWKKELDAKRHGEKDSSMNLNWSASLERMEKEQRDKEDVTD